MMVIRAGFFFQNLLGAAEITGISYDLIYRLNVVLETLSGRCKINFQKYHKYGLEVAKLYLN